MVHVQPLFFPAFPTFFLALLGCSSSVVKTCGWSIPAGGDGLAPAIISFCLTLLEDFLELFFETFSTTAGRLIQSGSGSYSSDTILGGQYWVTFSASPPYFSSIWEGWASSNISSLMPPFFIVIFSFVRFSKNGDTIA